MAEKKQWDGDGVPLAESNCAGIGSDEDKAVRKKAAEAESCWTAIGDEPGVLVWRIESFKVVPWPKEEYGKFYKGDSYIVLSTVKLDSGALQRDIHFWLGESTSTDEKGTAAYKTVELDDYFDGAPTQHREVMGKESKAFQKLFKEISYLEGGVDSGFNKVGADVYQSRLLQVRKTKSDGVRVMQVGLTRDSLNQGDCFVLDAGTKLYVWNGESSSPFEKNKANTVAENIENTRGGKASTTHDMDGKFWELLGGEGPIKGAGEVPDIMPEVPPGEAVLYKISDSDGDLKCEEVGRGELSKSMLNSNDVMMLDTEAEVYLWVGAGASPVERRNALRTATSYLKTNGKPADTAVTMLKEGAPVQCANWNKVFVN
eukprot:gnl/TRDRNA2_/TRDRNA2_190149_c0_seq1.p1 gnl/TRDRNA2_/TRDRNA2_190149_c0~~gnl/TRDRNA2_/TRDRNA2_190149_c0_seq1.p1  ORF type:complete len:395 (-),score=102.95 gnl/TRDRNA2_/TRDRNA2_190149_c0_seq1:61-1176(-)